MPTQRVPHLTSRRHAELFRHLIQGQDGGAAVKDLRLRRVVPLASAPLDSSPDGAPATPGSAQTTPPETQDPERKPAPLVSRSKLVRDPSSFGYRRLLPFLNELANDDDSFSGKDNSKTGLTSSPFQSLDESAGSEAESGAVDCSIRTKEETKIDSAHLSSVKPCLTRCQRSRFVRHPSSFSYKRMLPFLMDNEISSQEGHRAKIPRIIEEKQSSTYENDILTSGQHHLAMSGDSAEECETNQVKRSVEEKQSKSGGSQDSHLEGSPIEMGKLTEERVLTLDGYRLSSDKGELTSNWNDVLPAGQHQLTVSENTSEESNKEVERITEEKGSIPDENSLCHGRQLRTSASKVSPPEGSTAPGRQAVTSDGDKGNPLALGKGGSLAKEQPEIRVSEELVVKGNAERDEVHQCQSLELGCSDGCVGGPTKTVMPFVNGHGAREQPDSRACLDEPLLYVGMTCSPVDLCATGTPFSVEETPGGALYTPDPCSVGTPLSVEEMSGSVVYIEPASSKVSAVGQRAAPCLEKRGLSPKKLSPRKGILKKHTRGCKGICMCLDCSTFRLHADRAFEFSRKQMQEADDIIDNLLKEVESLRNLMEKSSGQEATQTACRHASQVEEVARERRRQMLMELNSHCRIPGPRVKFAQYVEERMASSQPPSQERISRV